MDSPMVLLCGLDPDVAEELRSRGYIVEPAADGFRAIELAERTAPAVAVVKTGVAGPSARDLLRRIKSCAPECRVVVVVDDADVRSLSPLLRAGADGALLDVPGPGFLGWALDRVMEGGAVLSPEIARALLDTFTETLVREREWSRTLAWQAHEADSLAKAKAEFLGNVSHELRTPLTIIKATSATLARMDGDVQDRNTHLAEVEAAADQLTAMVDSLLTEAEMGRGEFALDFQPCDAAEAIREGAHEAAVRYPALRVAVQTPAAMPVICDARAIRGVVRQLVDNACRYSESAGTVGVAARLLDEGATVHVTDRGPGLARGQLAAAFDQAFSPGEEVMTKQRAGLGLGLNLARSLIALHGGILWAEPLPAGGSRVSFTIPVEGPSEQAIYPEAPASASSSS